MDSGINNGLSKAIILYKNQSNVYELINDALSKNVINDSQLLGATELLRIQGLSDTFNILKYLVESDIKDVKKSNLIKNTILNRTKNFIDCFDYLLLTKNLEFFNIWHKSVSIAQQYDETKQIEEILFNYDLSKSLLKSIFKTFKSKNFYHDFASLLIILKKYLSLIDPDEIIGELLCLTLHKFIIDDDEIWDSLEKYDDFVTVCDLNSSINYLKNNVVPGLKAVCFIGLIIMDHILNNQFNNVKLVKRLLKSDFYTTLGARILMKSEFLQELIMPELIQNIGDYPATLIEIINVFPQFYKYLSLGNLNIFLRSLLNKYENILISESKLKTWMNIITRILKYAQNICSFQELYFSLKDITDNTGKLYSCLFVYLQKYYCFRYIFFLIYLSEDYDKLHEIKSFLSNELIIFPEWCYTYLKHLTFENKETYENSSIIQLIDPTSMTKSLRSRYIEKILQNTSLPNIPYHITLNVIESIIYHDKYYIVSDNLYFLLNKYVSNITFVDLQALAKVLKNYGVKICISDKTYVSASSILIEFNEQGRIKHSKEVLAAMTSKSFTTGNLSSFKFHNENTSGSGFRTGVIEKLWSYIEKKINNDKYLNNRLDSEIMKSYGILLALSLKNSIPRQIPNDLFKYLCGYELDIQDVHDTSIISNVNSLMYFDETTLEEMQISPFIQIGKNSKYLFNILESPYQNDTIINKTNVETYIKSFESYYTCKQCSPRKKNFINFKKGFDLISRNTNLENYPNLAYLRLATDSFRRVIDKKNIKNHLSYTGKSSNEIQRIHNILVKYLESLTDERFSKFLEFVTSSRKMYRADSGIIKITVKLLESSDKFPTSATCTKTLNLPCYPTEEILVTKMNTCLDNLSGFEYA